MNKFNYLLVNICRFIILNNLKVILYICIVLLYRELKIVIYRCVEMMFEFYILV